jgi:hypothetical protein
MQQKPQEEKKTGIIVGSRKRKKEAEKKGPK